MKTLWCVLFCGFCSPLAAAAQADPAAADAAPGAQADEATHNELRALREDLTKAVLEGDVEKQLAHVHENVVATWQNNQVVRGRDGLRKFMNELNVGGQKVFQGYVQPPTADELTIFYGDTGIVFGKSVPHYNYHGMQFDLENRWTATLVKENGQWKIAAYHVSGNIIDNPVLTLAKHAAYWAGGICLALGAILGGLGVALSKKRRQPSGR